MVLKLNISHYYQQYVSECDAPFKAVFKYKWFNTSKIFLLQMDSRGGPKSPQACEYDFSNCFPNLTTFHHFHFTASVRATSERLGCSSGLAGLPSPNSFALHVVLPTQPKDPVRNVCRVAPSRGFPSLGVRGCHGLTGLPRGLSELVSASGSPRSSFSRILAIPPSAFPSRGLCTCRFCLEDPARSSPLSHFCSVVLSYTVI